MIKDEVQLLLIQAMSLLEGYMEVGEGDNAASDAVYFAHQHIQRAWGIYAKHEYPSQLTDECIEYVNKWRENAIMDDECMIE